MYLLVNTGLIQQVQDFFSAEKQVPLIDTRPIRLVEQNGKDPFKLHLSLKYSVKEFDLPEAFKIIFGNSVEPNDFYTLLYQAHKETLSAQSEFSRVLRFSLLNDDGTLSPDAEKLYETILRNLTDIGNYFTVKQEKQNVPISTYVPTTKYQRCIDIKDETKQRLSVQRNLTSVVRFALDRDNVSISDADVEHMANRMKQYFLDSAVEVIEISGEDIREAYLMRNHHVTADIGDMINSCMRYDVCQPWLDLYTKNPNKISMIVARQRGHGVLGRSLVWLLDDGERAHDRVYGSGPTQLMIKRYATKHGIKNKDYLYEHGIVTLDEYEFKHYPFLDTLYYGHVPTKRLFSDYQFGRQRLQSSADWRYHRNAHGGFNGV